MDEITIKNMAYRRGADLCGIASVERFRNAPKGFNPLDIYSKCRSVIVFARRIPHESLYAENCVPYTHINTIALREVDSLAYALSLELHDAGIGNVIIPSDDPYEYWEPENSYGRAILSLRHA